MSYSRFRSGKSSRKMLHLIGVLLPFCSALAFLPGTAAAQCTAMTHTGHWPGYGTTVSSLSAPPLSVSFNYPVAANSIIVGNNVYLEEFYTGVRVPITTSVNGSTLNIKPVSPLKPQTYYRYQVRAGIKGTPQPCGTPAYNSSHGNNWYTGHACGGPDIIYTPMTLLKGCTYSLDYRNDYVLNVDSDPKSETVTLGTFSYTRTAPVMYDFGLSVKMTGIHFDASRNQWIASNVTVTGYNDNGNGGQYIPMLQQYSNIAVASGTGAFPFSQRVFDVRGTLPTTPGGLNTVGTITAQGTPTLPPTCTAGNFDFVNSPLTLKTPCTYDINYQNDYVLNVEADPKSETVNMGLFSYTRTEPSMYDFGLAVNMTGVRFDTTRNQWIASTVTVTGYNDNGNGGQYTPVLRQYSNVAVASSSGAFTFSLRVFDAYGTNPYYNASSLNAVGTATAK